jgi:hypothetical protein
MYRKILFIWSSIARLLANAIVLSIGCLAGSAELVALEASAHPASASSRARISYSVKESGKMPFAPGTLLATIDGKSSVLIDESRGKCLEVVDQRDFDGDGSVDALVEDITACGGNCCADGFFFVSALPDGTFAISDEFVVSWGCPVIEKWHGRWSVVVVSSNEGFDNRSLLEITRRFVLQRGKAVKVEELQRKELKAIAEMRSEIFKGGDPNETHSLKYDLNGDGKNDTIRGELWERWGRILWTVEFANGKTFTSSIGCKRIGVLASKTNGVNDLVCDQDTVLHWNGDQYK